MVYGNQPQTMIKDKVVIITGASSGIGEATAKLLASKGAKLALGARHADKLKQIVDEIEKDGCEAVFRELDVTDPSDNDDIEKLAKKTFGRVDVIFLNAGIMPNSPLSALKTDDWYRTVDVWKRNSVSRRTAALCRPPALRRSLSLDFMRSFHRRAGYFNYSRYLRRIRCTHALCNV
jgi:NADP-dependent 3-hydroxy acid dehydrogenase YdfG